jgi:predicted O-methyltransferase YrrM
MRGDEPKERYLDQLFGLPDTDLKHVRERMLETGLDAMSISGAEARILQFLIRGFGVRKVIEFGTFLGYSALAMAKALPSDGLVVTLENNPKHHAWAAETFKASPEGKKILSLCGDAHDLMAEIEAGGPYDLAFVDADKSAYADYLTWCEKNVRRGGLIVGDNTFLWGALWNRPELNMRDDEIQAMSEFNRRLSDPIRYNSILIPTLEGMTIGQKL